MSAISQLTHFPGGEDERELSVYRAITSIIMQVINNDSLAKEVRIQSVAPYSQVYIAFVVIKIWQMLSCQLPFLIIAREARNGSRCEAAKK